MSRAREPKPSPEASWRSSHESFVEEEPEQPGPRERLAHAATVPLGIVRKSEAPRYEPRFVEEPAKPGTSRTRIDVFLRRFAKAWHKAIVASLVHAHGGRLWHEATPGGGATFVVSLPFTAGSQSAPGNASGGAPTL